MSLYLHYKPLDFSFAFLLNEQLFFKFQVKYLFLNQQSTWPAKLPYSFVWHVKTIKSV